MCGGSLISARLIASSYHCAIRKTSPDKHCDHSDRKRIAIIGAHEIDLRKATRHYTIPIIQVFYPDGAKFRANDPESHDFALMLLEKPVQFGPKGWSGVIV